MENLNKPLVSLIAVCYNHKKFIETCINSLVKQSYGNTEIIVYDNASTDGSTEVLQSLQNIYHFDLICQENIGASKTVDKAIKYAKGKYIGFISTDDYWPLDKIEICVNFLENSDPLFAVCGGNAIIVDEDGVIYRKQTFANYHEIEFKDVFLDGKNIPAVTSLIKRSAFIEAGDLYDDISSEDMQMWLKITYKGYKIACLNQLLGYYRHHRSNMSHSKKISDKDAISNYKKYINEPDYERAIHNMYFRQFCRYVRIDKLYSLKFIKHLKFKYLNPREVLIEILFFLMPYKLIQKITRVI